MRRFYVFLCFIFLLIPFLPLALFGQDSSQPSSEGGQSLFMIFFLSGGSFLGILTTLPIVCLSIASTTLIIEHVMTLHRDKLVAPEIVVQLEELIDKGQYEEAINLCESAKNFVTNTVGVALIKANEGEEAMVAAAESQVVEENTKLTHKISWLNLIGNIGPMLGLFGTVVGMVTAFTEIANTSDQPSPKQLAGGIYTALITTVWGLIVAMPSLSAYFVFKNKIQRIGLELTAISGELIERCKPGVHAK